MERVAVKNSQLLINQSPKIIKNKKKLQEPYKPNYNTGFIKNKIDKLKRKIQDSNMYDYNNYLFDDNI